MDDDELHALVEELEAGLRQETRTALTLTAQDFATAVQDADELVAAAFGVSRIGAMWRRRVGALVESLRRIARRGAAVAAEDLQEPVPPETDTSPVLDPYFDQVRTQLNAVGDRLSERAVTSLREGIELGETQAELKQRMLAVFSDDGAQLGEGRATRIAMTSATSAFNAGVLAGAQALTGPDRPLVKQWVTRRDTAVRSQHRDADGQLQLLDDPFDVAGVPMRFPGDPTAPPNLSINCRCVTRVSAAPTATASAVPDEELQSRMPERLKDYWLRGPGAARIRWGTPGSFTRCVRALRDDFPQNPEGLCANLYHEATGQWPGKRNSLEGNTMDDDDLDMPYEPPAVTWSTPDGTALAFENQQTGDGRVFTPGALYWDGTGPWPLKLGHDAETELAGAIHGMGRDGDRIPAHGVLYPATDAGWEAATLLAQGAPLGVSVDLDDVDYEVLVSEDSVAYKGRLVTASVLPLADGYIIKGQTADEVHASADGTAATSMSRTMTFRIDADGLVAAAGDSAWAEGAVVDGQKSGDFLMRITRARIRGASLVTIPAFDRARIVLDDPGLFADGHTDEAVTAAIKSTTDYERVLRHVRRSNQPVGAARLAQFLKMPLAAAQRLLAVAASRGEVVRLTRGLYTDKTTSAKADHVMMDDMTASVTGSVDLPVAPRDTTWDGAAALRRMVEAGVAERGCAYQEDGTDGTAAAHFKLPYADVIDGSLAIVPNGVSAAIGAVNGARGGVDIPDDQISAVRERLEEVSTHVSEETGEEESEGMQASAWKAMHDLPPMPAEWFREPTLEELPPGGPGVNYSNGRIFGWVAQAGEPHAGFAKKITIDGLGRVDTTHFLRQRFTLDDGTTVKAGAYTMNVGHHRDGAECETSACQFDDTRTVAGIVTVGMNERGMWFSGAAAPWLSEWDRRIFAATQPSYHMKKGPAGNWQLRAVLSVPVPGHSSPLLASAVVERAQLALTAAANMAEVEEAVAAENERQAAVPHDVADVAPEAEARGHDVAASDGIDYDKLAAAMVLAQERREAEKAAEAAELAALMAEAELIYDEIAASAAPEDSADTDKQTITSEEN